MASDYCEHTCHEFATAIANCATDTGMALTLAAATEKKDMFNPKTRQHHINNLKVCRDYLKLLKAGSTEILETIDERIAKLDNNA